MNKAGITKALPFKAILLSIISMLFLSTSLLFPSLCRADFPATPGPGRVSPKTTIVRTEGELVAAFTDANSAILAGASFALSDSREVPVTKVFEQAPGSIIDTNGFLLTIYKDGVHAPTQQRFAAGSFVNFQDGAVINVEWFTSIAEMISAIGSMTGEARLVLNQSQTATAPLAVSSGKTYAPMPGAVLTTTAANTLTFAAGSHLKDNGETMFTATVGEVSFASSIATVKTDWFSSSATRLQVAAASLTGSQTLKVGPGTLAPTSGATVSVNDVTVDAEGATISAAVGFSSQYLLTMSGARGKVRGGLWDGNSLTRQGIVISGNGCSVDKATVKEMAQQAGETSAAVGILVNNSVDGFTLTDNDVGYVDGAVNGIARAVLIGGSTAAATNGRMSNNYLHHVTHSGSTTDGDCLQIQGNDATPVDAKIVVSGTVFGYCQNRVIKIQTDGVTMFGTIHSTNDEAYNQGPVVSIFNDNVNFFNNTLIGNFDDECLDIGHAAASIDTLVITGNICQNLDALAGVDAIRMKDDVTANPATISVANIILGQNIISGYRDAVKITQNVSNLVMNANIADTTSDCIEWGADAGETLAYFSIMGNVCRGSAGGFTAYAGSASTVTNAVSVGNTGDKSAGSSISSGASRGLMSMGNVAASATNPAAGNQFSGPWAGRPGSSITSADSITLPTDGQLFSLAGGTPIATIVETNHVAGEIVCLYGDADGETLKHGTGNIYLQGAADLTISNVKPACVRYYGSNWIQE